MDLAKMIDHTLLKPEATPAQIETLCAEARQYGFASVCVNSCYAALCARLLRGSGVKVCVVIGFPLGAMSTAAKEFEARRAVQDGADELDMVQNVGMLRAGQDAYVRADIAAVVEAAGGRAVKVILETGLLTEEEKVRACRIAVEAGAAFVKTCTGFSKGVAAAADVRLMRQTVGPETGVKASAGIRDYSTAMEMIEAGASRIGASAGVAILAGQPKA